jgi:aspartyl-tRNA(Asn)/glutamyl-tRNA(Gln) amidotransferase subunit C
MTAQLSREDVLHVATLARLKLSDAELETFTSQLAQVLDYVDILNEVDTDEVEPMAHAAGLTNVFREDAVRDSLPREAALANAPKTDGQCFLVPPIL